MNDFVFSQLEDISNDTFDNFSPYSPSSSPSSSSFSSYSSSYDVSDNSYLFNDDHYYSSSSSSNHNSPSPVPSTSSSTSSSSSQYDHPSSPSLYNQQQQQQQPYHHQQQQQYHQQQYHHQQQQWTPNEIIVRGVDLQDHNGQQLRHERIADIKLKLFSHFFGLEYNDSISGKAVSQFYPGDIVTVVRQCDRIGIFIQFRRFLTSRKFSDAIFQQEVYPQLNHHHNNNNNNHNQQQHVNNNNNNNVNTSVYFRDSPFVHCMNMMLEFADEYQIHQIFNYMLLNDMINSTLKMVYNQWMFCAEVCTASDVHLISMTMNNQGTRNKHMQYGTNACSAAVMIRDGDDNSDSYDSAEEDDNVCDTSDNEEAASVQQQDNVNADINNLIQSFIDMKTSSNDAPKQGTVNNGRKVGLPPTSGRGYTWAKSAKVNAHKPKGVDQQSLVLRKKALPKQNFVIETSKIESVLPPHFASISSEVRQFAMLLLKQSKLLPFQFTVQFCNALAIAETDAAKLRAMSLLNKMSTYHTPVQLKDISQVARYLLGNMSPCSAVNQSSPSASATTNPSPSPTNKKMISSNTTSTTTTTTSEVKAAQSPPPRGTARQSMPNNNNNSSTGKMTKNENPSKRSPSLVSETTDYGGGESPSLSAGQQHSDKCAIM